MERGFYIRKNTKELRDKLVELGHLVCKCAEFEDARWLHISRYEDNGFHGVGFRDEVSEFNMSVEDVLNYFEKETKDFDCGTNEELFIALAALLANEKINPKVNYLCCYVNDKYNWIQVMDKNTDTVSVLLQAGYHRANKDEIITHFYWKTNQQLIDYIKEHWYISMIDCNTLLVRKGRTKKKFKINKYKSSEELIKSIEEYMSMEKHEGWR